MIDMLYNMHRERIKLGVGAIRPELIGFDGKFVLAFNKCDGRKEIMLYADAGKKEFSELIEQFNLPAGSILGGGTMNENTSNPRFPCAADAAVRLTSESFSHKGADGEWKYFSGIPLELAEVCIRSKYHTGVYIGEDYVYMALTITWPGKNLGGYGRYDEVISSAGFVDGTTDFLMTPGDSSSIRLVGPMAIQLFLAQRGILENSEEQIQQIAELIKKRVDEGTKRWLAK